LEQQFFVKEPHDPAFVSWHQDSTYWGLDPPEAVTAWVALSASNDERGWVRFIPGTHLWHQLPHRERAHEHNLLSRGQEIAIEVNESQAVSAILESGEMSLHDIRLVHGSDANRSLDRRIGFAIRYVPTHVRQTAGTDYAMLVRGGDKYRHFEPEMRPVADMDGAAVAHHSAVMQRHVELVMSGAEKKQLK
jgi:ectoine hydroxylase-related dioxygenase (phytanoyl-CoA dioxygenase family)